MLNHNLLAITLRNCDNDSTKMEWFDRTVFVPAYNKSSNESHFKLKSFAFSSNKLSSNWYCLCTSQKPLNCITKTKNSKRYEAFKPINSQTHQSEKKKLNSSLVVDVDICLSVKETHTKHQLQAVLIGCVWMRSVPLDCACVCIKNTDG